MSFITEFRDFAVRGNVVDLAVAVIIGTAFGKIVSALVDGIVMPFIGLLIGGINIANKTIVFGNAVIKWGMFLQSVLDFGIIAFAIFCAIKFIYYLHLKEAEVPKLTKEQALLTEIRDLLKEKKE